MRKFLVGLGVAILVVAALLAGSVAWLEWRIKQEAVTPLQVLNPAGTAGKALLIVSPGMSSFPDDVLAAFGEGLVTKGWRIERTTASREAVADVGRYDLIVLGSPVYGGKAAPALDAYVKRVADFGGKPVIVLLTAAANAERAKATASAIVTGANGRLAGTFAYTSMRPNDEENRYTGSNTQRALQMARDAALAAANIAR